MTIFASEIFPNNSKRYKIMKKVFLVYRIDYLVDSVNGDGKFPLWCTESKEKAVSDVTRLTEHFLKDKRDLGLSYDMRYYYEEICLY